MRFQNDDKTYVYDYKLDFWSEWSYWDHLTGKRQNYIGRVGAYITKWNKYITGSRNDGKLYIASREYTTDEGEDIIPEFVTSRIDWGTSYRKSSDKIRIKAERGLNGVTDTDTPYIYFSKRDNGNRQWSKERKMNLGIAGDNQSYKTFKQLGTYRDRQWRFRMQGALTTIASVTEDYEVIG